MLGLALKRGAHCDVYGPIRSYLATRYPEAEVERHTSGLQNLQTLRDTALAISAATEGGATTLRQYAALLVSASQRILVGDKAGAKLSFLWSDSFIPDRAVEMPSLPYELSCVVFNLAALESQMGTKCDRSTPEGGKAARAHFSTAAGLLQWVRDGPASQLVAGAGESFDLSPDGLNFCINLLLAQAQAIVYESATKQGMRPETVYQVAGGAADYYRAAARSLACSREASVVEGGWPWAAHCNSWASLFDAAAFNRRAAHLHAQAETTGDGYGEAIAWLSAAESAAERSEAVAKASAPPTVKGKPQGPPRVDPSAAAALLADLRPRKVSAIDDNKRVYFQLVPSISDLPALPRAVMAKATPFNPLTDLSPSALGVSDPFAAMLPPEVAAALVRFDGGVDEIVRESKKRAADATAAARALLSELGLPGQLEAGGDAAGLPDSVWARVHGTQVAGGLAELDRLQSSNGALSNSARDSFRQTEGVLDGEEAADRANREAWGARWTAAPSAVVAAEMRATLSKYAATVVAASSSDAALASKLEAFRPALASLSRTRADLVATVPPGYQRAAAASGGADPAEPLRAELRSAVSQLTTLLDERPRIAAGISSAYDRGATAAALTSNDPSEHGGIVERALTAPSPASAALDASLAQQSRLLDSIRAAHGRYCEVRAQDERSRAREQAIGSICDACDRFEEVRSGLKEGEAFWRELKARADALLVSARDMAQARAMQARETLMNLQVQAQAQAQAQQGAGHYGGPAPQLGPAGSHSPYATAGGYGSYPGAGAGAVQMGVPVATPLGAGGSGYQLQPLPIASVASGNPFDSPRVPSAGPATPVYSGGAGAAGGGGGPSPVPLAPGWGAAPGYPAYPQAGPAYTQQQQQPSAGVGGDAGATSAQSQLVSMGFAPAQVQRALAMHRGDREAALNQLLTDG